MRAAFASNRMPAPAGPKRKPLYLGGPGATVDARDDSLVARLRGRHSVDDNRRDSLEIVHLFRSGAGPAMALNAPRDWLISYDIRDPRRLVRLHRFLKGVAAPVQYSVFAMRDTPGRIGRLTGDIEARIHVEQDDV